MPGIIGALAAASSSELHALFVSVVKLLELRLGIAKARKDEAAADVLLDWLSEGGEADPPRRCHCRT